MLLLDEPANGLDPQGIRWLRDFLRAFAARGNAVLVSSHLLAEMSQLADEVIVISKGRLIRQAAVHDLTSGAPTHVRARSADDAGLGRALSAAGLSVTPEANGLAVSGATAEVVGRLAFDSGIPVFELGAEEISLEDVFLEMTSDMTQEEATR